MQGGTNAGASAREKKEVTARTEQITVAPSKGKLLEEVKVNPTPSQTKTVTAGTGNVNVSPDSGKLLSGVTIKPTPTQEKTATPTTSEQTVVPDSGKHLSKVTVKAKPSIKVDGTEVETDISFISQEANITLNYIPDDIVYKGSNSSVLLTKFNGELRAISGYQKSNPLKCMYRLDGASGDWTDRATLPVTYFAGAVEVGNHLILANRGGIYTYDGETFTKGTAIASDIEEIPMLRLCGIAHLFYYYGTSAKHKKVVNGAVVDDTTPPFSMAADFTANEWASTEEAIYRVINTSSGAKFSCKIYKFSDGTWTYLGEKILQNSGASSADFSVCATNEALTVFAYYVNGDKNYRATWDGQSIDTLEFQPVDPYDFRIGHIVTIDQSVYSAGGYGDYSGLNGTMRRALRKIAETVYLRQ